MKKNKNLTYGVLGIKIGLKGCAESISERIFGKCLVLPQLKALLGNLVQKNNFALNKRIFLQTLVPGLAVKKTPPKITYIKKTLKRFFLCSRDIYYAKYVINPLIPKGPPVGRIT